MKHINIMTTTNYTEIELAILNSENYKHNSQSIDYLGDFYKTNNDQSVFSVISKTESEIKMHMFDVEDDGSHSNAYTKIESLKTLNFNDFLTL
ncbi:hypothetical protein MA9V2_219 [Chryseobacterium phage MA9V-2]|nr:hypothetical protein MA9V2_219 [Chryseobacterium phage MA9V-2]